MCIVVSVIEDGVRESEDDEEVGKGEGVKWRLLLRRESKLNRAGVIFFN